MSEQEWKVIEENYCLAVVDSTGRKILWLEKGWKADPRRVCEAVADAHNAALADERENIRLRSEKMQALVSENVCLRNQLAATDKTHRRELADTETLCGELQQQLAAEREKLTVWKRIAEAHDCCDLTDAFVQLTKARKQLDAEREKRIRWTNNSMTNLQIAERNAQIIDGLKSELASAQAAIAELPNRYAEHLEAAAKAGELGDVDEKYQVDLMRAVISDVDLSALDKHADKVRKPLVEALEWIDNEIEGEQFPSNRQIQRKIADALMK